MTCVTYANKGVLPDGTVANEAQGALCQVGPLADIACRLRLFDVQRQGGAAQPDGAIQREEQRRDCRPSGTHCDGHAHAPEHREQGPKTACGAWLCGCGIRGLFGSRWIVKIGAVSPDNVPGERQNGDHGFHPHNLEPHHNFCARPVTIFVQWGLFSLTMSRNRHNFCDDWGLVPSQFLCASIESAIQGSPKGTAHRSTAPPTLATLRNLSVLPPSQTTKKNWAPAKCNRHF